MYTLPNHEIIPEVTSPVFQAHPEAVFAAGLLAVGGEVRPGLEHAYTGYLKLRANVYGRQTGLVGADHITESGLEVDQDDARSAHFGILENVGNGHQRVVGSMRIITKNTDAEAPLPTEAYFAEEFQDHNVPAGKSELSRYILRHEVTRTQDRLKWPLYKAVTAFVLAESLEPTYCVIESELERNFKANRLPVSRVTEAKAIEDYDNTINAAVRVDMTQLGRMLGIDDGSAQELAYGFSFYDEHLRNVDKYAA